MPSEPTPPPTPRERYASSTVRWRAWAVEKAPIPLLTHSHEVGISVALGLVALPLLGGAPGPESIHSQVPSALATTWAWVLLLSSTLTIWGLFGNRPRAEWAGQLFTGYGLMFYAMALVAGIGWGAVVVAAIFAVLGLVAWWRAFKITNSALVQARLLWAARNAHEEAHTLRTLRSERRPRR